MGDESDQSEKIPADKVLRMRMDGHLLADHFLQRAILHHTQVENEQLRAELNRRERKELYDRVIEKYNRSHSHRKKTTLKEICEQMEVSYEAVKKHRLRIRKNKSQ